ncbi:hypothetical protein EJ06DRAFT_529359 [Trichodelitschia bisporula]|uniref:peptidylprolyl isomerase n=1 Tax=Trichodelitschia bisporula TaxID=703511 RepID=A0A6G1HZR1_9PEZI|nr:hypothetical protein EJ06DRAFT_529359 [Trichodelitschia bisporula]
MLFYSYLPVFFSILTSILAAEGSSCNVNVHNTTEVAWQVTRCAYCYMGPHDDGRTKANDVLWINYNGTLINGSLFDSSYTPEKPWPAGDPFNFTLGAKQVITGFDAGLYDMCPRERRRLTIPPKYAYGEKGVPDVIPPNSTLVFEVELMKVVKVGN